MNQQAAIAGDAAPRWVRNILMMIVLWAAGPHTPEEVRDWLGSLAPKEICGRPQWPDDCPLARFLNARNGHTARRVSVACDSYSLADGCRRVGGIRRCMPPGRCALGRRRVIVRRRCRSRRGW